MLFRTPVDGKWVVGRQIGSGFSGRVFEARDNQGREAVVKISRDFRDGFYREVQVSRAIDEEERGFPKIHFYGSHEGRHTLVMQRFRHSLYDIFRQPTSSFTRTDTLKIAIQMLDRIETLHDYGYVHRDLSPENIMLSSSNGRTLYLTDFGRSKTFLNFARLHVLRHASRPIPVTFNFGSINAMEGFSPSRRDDLESLIYTLVYLHNGSLPWSDLDGESNLGEILNMKSQIQSRELCNGLSSSITSMCRRVRNLTYTEKPSYSSYRRRLTAALQDDGSSERDGFSWQA